jgi:hypothetical protein
MGCAIVQSIVTTGRVVPELAHYDQAMLGLIAGVSQRLAAKPGEIVVQKRHVRLLLDWPT